MQQERMDGWVPTLWFAVALLSSEVYAKHMSLGGHGQVGTASAISSNTNDGKSEGRMERSRTLRASAEDPGGQQVRPCMFTGARNDRGHVSEELTAPRAGNSSVASTPTTTREIQRGCRRTWHSSESSMETSPESSKSIDTSRWTCKNPWTRTRRTPAERTRPDSCTAAHRRVEVERHEN